MASRSVSFFVPGVPAPQGSKRHVGKGRMVESSKAVGPWRSTVALAARAAHNGAPIDGPVRVSCAFVFPRPKHHLRANGEVRESAPWRHSSRPDIDKLARAVLDGITGIVLRDDGQVSSLLVQKWYGNEPGVEIYVVGG